MTIRIVHLSISPCAGQPFRLVNALNKFTDYDLHLIDSHRWGIYSHDLVFDEDKESCIDLISQADIIHFHNYLTLESSAFSPINFIQLKEKGKTFIRHIHSEPSALSRIMGLSEKEIITYDLPTLVIAQYPERFFPNAFVVRNNLPIYDPEYLPSNDACQWDLFFSPSKRISAWADRWNTKGSPETNQLMWKVAKETGCSFKVITKQPLSAVLQEKNRSYIVLDDMVTGSYHLSGLEGISMAKPTFAYLDNRIQHVMREVSGSIDLPYINTVLENSGSLIKYLLKNREVGVAIGRAGRNWLECYWSEDLICQEFFDVYEKLLSDPNLISRQENLRLDSCLQKFFAITLPDEIYEERKAQHLKLSICILDWLGKLLKRIKNLF